MIAFYGIVLPHQNFTLRDYPGTGIAEHGAVGNSNPATNTVQSLTKLLPWAQNVSTNLKKCH